MTTARERGRNGWGDPVSEVVMAWPCHTFPWQRCDCGQRVWWVGAQPRMWLVVSRQRDKRLRARKVCNRCKRDVRQ